MFLQYPSLNTLRIGIEENVRKAMDSIGNSTAPSYRDEHLQGMLLNTQMEQMKTFRVRIEKWPLCCY